MPLATGARLGSFEVVSALGAGGMGEVYRARDTRLGRDVAIKVLPHVFTADRDRLARFEREARVLASLNHPNIATIFPAFPVLLSSALPVTLQFCNSVLYVHPLDCYAVSQRPIFLDEES